MNFPGFRSTFVAVCSLAIVLVAAPTMAQAQTVAGFTNVSGWSGMKVNSTTYLADAYDGASGLDPTKQNSLNGSNSVWDMVGNQSTYLFQVATGTTSSGSAVAFSIRLGDYTSQGLKQGSVGLIMEDTNGYFGYGLQFAANGGVSIYRLKPVTPINLTPSGFTYTWGNNAAANNTNTIASGASTILYNYQSATSGTSLSTSGDAWLTFVVSLTEIQNFRSDSNWSYNANVGALAFTSSNALNGNINSDYPGTSTSSLTFSAESGSPVPEFPTALLLGGLLAPLGALQWWRRRRAIAAQS